MWGMIQISWIVGTMSIRTLYVDALLNYQCLADAGHLGNL